MEDGNSGTEQEQRKKALKAAAQRYVQEIAHLELGNAIAEALGTSNKWSVLIDPEGRGV